MLKLTKLQLVCVAVMAILGVSYASAFNASSYSSSSKLASGKWVKITIPESGMYEITYDEMRAMGFTNPAQVRVYGRGGNRINELMSSSFSDDLNLVPILRKNNKICFYGNGPIGYTISNYNTTPHFTRVFNPYSQVGCYFLSDMSGSDLTPSKKTSVTVNNYISTTDCLSFFIHENELTSISSSGKEMLGEDFTTKPVYIDYKLPGLADSSIVVHTVIAAKASQLSYANAVIHSGGTSDTTTYSVSSSRIYKPANNVYYNFASPYAQLKLTHPAENGQYEPTLFFPSTDDLSLTMARLDYFILTYKRKCVIRSEDDNQLTMGFAATNGTERFEMPNASSNVVVWSIDDVNTPKEVTTKSYSDDNGGGRYFTSPSANVSMYVAFDPTKTLKKISAYEIVENQNLHGMAVPDMLIITTKPFLDQAQRLADMHTAVDGIDVAVVDHEKIFNEFSSGTRDAMAYRLLCKMLYDRDVNKNKFKNLLLFGPGSFDNRELMGEHPTNLLTYQSDNSNYQDFSYTTDDFFGFLDDNSGSNIPSEKLRIGIGRITCADVEEAKSDVDKIVEYYATPDYGVWRNNNLVSSDSPDGGLYMFQAEGYKELMDTTLKTNTHITSVHNSMYPRSPVETKINVDNRTATVAKQLMTQLFKNGVYFATYVGHAGPVTFTKTNHMWTTGDVANTSYSRWPVMSTACCEVAHYDSDTRGIAELMFHKRHGGAIALLTSSRMVYATGNDRLNRYFISALFSYGSTGRMATLGEAYMKSKLGFPTSDTNKMSFFLLGDPALKFNYPISRFNITKVNGTDMTNDANIASITPMSRFEIETQIVDANGNLDKTFNGDATLTLYDKQELFASLTLSENGVSVDRDIYFNRPKLAEITGRVTNGIFKGTIITPKQVLSKGDNVLIRAYAHKDNSDYMVNGSTDRVKLMAFDESTAIMDTISPKINVMYINDENSFVSGSAVGSNAMLYIVATDDQAISVQSNSLQNDMSLVLDAGKSSSNDISCYMTVTNDGKVVNIEYPLENLSAGMHTLTYTVYDLEGNFASRTITFMVGGQGGSAELVADKWPAYKGSEVHFDLNTDLARTPEMTVRVTDATGKLVWMTKGSTFPVAWDMKDMSGNAVPAGLYRYFGTYNDGSNYGGTPINKLIVLDPLKTAN